MRYPGDIVIFRDGAVGKILRSLSVKAAKPGATRREIPDPGCRGLYLVVQTNGAKSWAFRYRIAGATRKLTLGPAHDGQQDGAPMLDQPNTLAAARALASEAALQVAKGIDPAKEKFATRDRARQYAEGAIEADQLTVEVLARRFVRDHALKRTREKSWRQTARLLGVSLAGMGAGIETRSNRRKPKLGGEVISRWGSRPAHSITRGDVNALLRAIVAAGAPVTSNRVLAAVRKMFNWAVAEDILAVSPCVGVTAKADEQSRNRILSDDELRVVWKASAALGYPFTQFTRLLILTMQRRVEVAGMRRDEIDRKNSFGPSRLSA